jgi:DNA-binding NarL/FixJ family response regulator
MTTRPTGETPAPAIRTLLIDDRRLFRAGIAAILGEHRGFHVVGAIDGGHGTLSTVRDLHPDVIVLNVGASAPSAADLIRELARTAPAARIVALLEFENPDLVSALVSLGAHGFVPTTAAPDELMLVMQTVCRDERVMLSISAGTARELDRSRRGLSPRERQVLALIADALSNAQIAHRVGIAEGTVKRHVTNVYAKLGVSSRVDAVSRGVAAGLISMPVPR